MLRYYREKGLAWKWSEPLGRGGQKTETKCESFPGYIVVGCVRAIGRGRWAGEGDITIVS